MTKTKRYMESWREIASWKKSKVLSNINAMKSVHMKTYLSEQGINLPFIFCFIIILKPNYTINYNNIE